MCELIQEGRCCWGGTKTTQDERKIGISTSILDRKSLDLPEIIFPISQDVLDSLQAKLGLKAVGDFIITIHIIIIVFSIIIIVIIIIIPTIIIIINPGGSLLPRGRACQESEEEQTHPSQPSGHTCKGNDTILLVFFSTSLPPVAPPWCQ